MFEELSAKSTTVLAKVYIHPYATLLLQKDPWEGKPNWHAGGGDAWPHPED